MAIDHSKTYTMRSVRNLGHQQRLRAISAAVESFSLPAGTDYADVGCSNGFITDRIRLLLDQSGAEAYDHVAEHFSAGRERHPALNFNTHDICANPLPRQFGLVTCFETLEHVGDPRQAVKHLLASLRPGGVLFVSVPIEYGFRGLIKYAAKRLVYRYGLEELPAGNRVGGDYLWALIRGYSISQFRESGRSGWGTHFGFDARDVAVVLNEQGVQARSWRSVFTEFYVVRKSPEASI